MTEEDVESVRRFERSWSRGDFEAEIARVKMFQTTDEAFESVGLPEHDG